MNCLISVLLLATMGQAPIDFADYLYRSGDYRRAATEYQRIAFMNLADTADTADTAWASYALLQAGEAFLEIDDAERAISIYSFGRNNLPSHGSSFTYGLLRAHFTGGDYGEVGVIAPELLRSGLERNATIYYSFSLALSGLADHAASELTILNPHPLIDETISVLETPLKRRSPFFSATLSTILPGAGQAYCGRWGDAWQSFSVTGLFAGAALYYFLCSSDTTTANTVKGIATASLGGLFWLGNIYGAVNTALDYNDLQERRRQERLIALLERFDLDPEIKRP